MFTAAGTGTPTAGANAGAQTITDRANGHTIRLRQGQLLRIVLSSTYWKIHGSSDSAVLTQQGGQATQPQPSGCVPGGGCGTATAVYRAVAAGQARVSASRSSCGEAMGCTSASSQFLVYVVVT